MRPKLAHKRRVSPLCAFPRQHDRFVWLIYASNVDTMCPSSFRNCLHMRTFVSCHSSHTLMTCGLAVSSRPTPRDRPICVPTTHSHKTCDGSSLTPYFLHMPFDSHAVPRGGVALHGRSFRCSKGMRFVDLQRVLPLFRMIKANTAPNALLL